MDEAVRVKAVKKKEKEEKLAMEKRLKALKRSYVTLYNQTLVGLRKWGPEMLQDVENIVALEERLSSPSKASKTPRRGKKKVLIASPSIIYTLPQLEFPDLPMAPVKARSTAPPLPLPPPPPSPPTAPSPSKKTTRRRKKAQPVIQEVIEPLATVTSGGRRSARRLFHDEVLANQRVS